MELEKIRIELYQVELKHTTAKPLGMFWQLPDYHLPHHRYLKQQYGCRGSLKNASVVLIHSLTTRQQAKNGGQHGISM